MIDLDDDELLVLFECLHRMCETNRIAISHPAEAVVFEDCRPARTIPCRAFRTGAVWVFLLSECRPRPSDHRPAFAHHPRVRVQRQLLTSLSDRLLEGELRELNREAGVLILLGDAGR